MKAETKKQANTAKKDLLAKGKTGVGVYKFATKRKNQFFVGTWWEWLAAIS